jgi:hypothetical protein
MTHRSRSANGNLTEFSGTSIQTFCRGRLAKRKNAGSCPALRALSSYRVAGQSAGRSRQSAGRRAVHEKAGWPVRCSSPEIAGSSVLGGSLDNGMPLALTSVLIWRRSE